MELYPHQKKELEATKNFNHVAYYHDMGLGKTFVGSEKMMELGEKINLIICQKSKVDDWVEHLMMYYNTEFLIFDLTDKVDMKAFMSYSKQDKPLERIGIINYELAFRREELSQLKDFTLLLDESSMIQNEKAKRSKFILNKLHPKNVILLSGTPTSGKYEKLWSQMHLLGWNISKDLYYKQFIKYHIDKRSGFPIMIIDGYKNVDRLKQKMRDYGCRFLKTEEVIDLPEQVFTDVHVDTIKAYRDFKENRIVDIKNKTLVGDTSLTKMLYERQLCGQYNGYKLQALKDLLDSTQDRVLVFYNFNEELYQIEDTCIEMNRPMAIVNGQTRDLTLYEEYDNSVTAIQYQAGSMGLNLQKSNKIIYFTPPLSSELFEQSKKRTHRIGQESTCFYYMLMCKNSIEEKIYSTLKMRKDYTDRLFDEQDR